MLAKVSIVCSSKYSFACHCGGDCIWHVVTMCAFPKYIDNFKPRLKKTIANVLAFLIKLQLQKRNYKLQMQNSGLLWLGVK